MPLTRIKQTALADDGVTTQKLDDTTGGFTLPGVQFVKVPVGTTAQRPGSAAGGQMRFNTTLGVLEQYNTNTNAWQAIDSPPIITTLAYSGSNTATDPAGGETITLNGSNFQSGATVTIGGTSATSVTVVSTTSITFVTPAKTAGDYDVVVANSNGLSATKTNGISYNGTPAFTTAAGNLGSILEDEAMSTITIVAAEPDGGTLAFSVTSGALPTGVTLGSANGQLTGTPNTNVSSNTTFNFTVTATDNENQTNSRAFNLIVLRPIYATQIANSIRFDYGQQDYMSRTPGVNGNRKIWTWSGWFKRANIGGTQVLLEATDSGGASTRATNRFLSDDTFSGGDSSSGLAYTTDRIFKDSTAWYHLVIAMDTTQATNTNRFKLYINGNLETFSSVTYPTQNLDTLYNSTSYFNYIAATQGAFTQYFDGYLSDVYFIDGQQLAPTAFAEEFNGVWAPKAYSGSFGAGGYRLTFSNGASLGADTSGNTPANSFTSHVASSRNNSVIDSPTVNFATLNPQFAGASETLKEGALKFDSGTWSSSVWGTKSTIPIPKDKKIYIEVRETGQTGAYYSAGISTESSTPTSTNVGGTGSVMLYGSNYYVNGTQTSHGGGTFAAGDKMGIAVDGATGKVWFSKNGTWLSDGSGNTGDPSSGSYPAGTVTNPNGEELFFTLAGNPSNNNTWVNFGQDSSNIASAVSPSNGIGVFEYDVPTGHVALCAKNLSESPVNTTLDDRPEDYFDTLLWNGNGTSGQDNTQAITGLTFQPDLVWIKSRNNAGSHAWYDSFRGNGSNHQYYLTPDTTAAEDTTYKMMNTIDSNGFTVNSLGGSNTNRTGWTYVGWCWKAGGKPTATNSATSGAMTANSVSLNGTLQSAYTPSGSPSLYPTKMSINTKAGFSIVSWTGDGNIRTIPHGLNEAPEFFILKGLDGRAWATYHDRYSAGNNTTNTGNYYAQLNAGPPSIDNAMFNSTAPTADVFTVGTYNYVNNINYMGYFWHSVPGYSFIGKWINTGANDGTYVHCGFKPSWIIIREDSAAGENWYLIDNKRMPLNKATGATVKLNANTNYSEASVQQGTVAVDFLAGGIKIRTTNAGSGELSYGTRHYAFMAFAEDPFKYVEGR